MRKKSDHRRRRDESNSESSSSYSEQSSKQPEDLYGDLKRALTHNDRDSYRLIRNISQLYKNDVGILRITLGGSFSFCQRDIQDFFSRFGKIENVIIKHNNPKLFIDETKSKQQQSIAYIIFSEYFSAVLALKTLNSNTQKQKILHVQICCKLPQNSQDKSGTQPVLYKHSIQNMILQIQQDYQWGSITQQYKYIGTIGLDLTDRNFKIRQRILGVQGCNFVRIYYLCDKSFKFQNQGEEIRQDDLKLMLLVNKITDNDRDVLVMSHSLQKYNHAIRYLHELMEQIVEEYKNSREKSTQIIARDIHIRRWEKFAYEPQLKFLT